MKRLKKKEHENLTSENIEKVIGLLHPEDGSKGISKKEACEILNIAYNTTRLQKIIDEHNDGKAYVELRKKQNRGKPASNQEIAEAVTGYLKGESVSEISRGLYRSPSFVRGILERVGVPERATGEEKKQVDYIPEQCVSDTFAEDEIVWSARHHATAIVRKEVSVDYQAEKPGFFDTNYEKKYSSKCYSIWVVEDIDDSKSEDLWARVETGGYNAYVCAYDLGKLEHLKEYGVRLELL